MSRLHELDVVIRRKNGKVVAGVPQLRLYVEADDTSSALAALDEKRNAFIAELEQTGELETAERETLPEPTSHHTGQRNDLGAFAIKTAIVAFAVAAVILVSGWYIASNVNASIERAVTNVKSIQIGGRHFWTHLEQQLDQMASPSADLPAEKKKKLLADIHAIGMKWRPFLVEIQSVVAAPPPAPASSAPTKQK